jgi:hypothetical protein
MLNGNCTARDGKLREQQMELLLNLIWLSLAALALLGFLRGRRVSGPLAQMSFRMSLFAVVCAVMLLFPVVSASDDLHPTQAALEEPSKKVLFAAVPSHLLRSGLQLFMLPATSALCLLGSLVGLQLLHSLILKARLLDGATVPSSGRAPPFCWN